MSKKNKVADVNPQSTQPDPVVEETKTGEESVQESDNSETISDLGIEEDQDGQPNTEHVTVEDPHKPVDETTDPKRLTEEEIRVIENPLTPDEAFKAPEEQTVEEPKPPVETEEEDKEEKPLFVSDNGVLPASIIAGQQFVVGLSQKLPIGAKIKSGTKTFVVDWANDAHRSTLDQRRNAYQTLLKLESRSEKPLKTSEYFSEKAEFEIL